MRAGATTGEINLKKNCGDAPPRIFADYRVRVGSAPAGVELIEML